MLSDQISHGRSLGVMKLRIIETRNIIRKHRDQKLDDRCWRDDDWIRKLVGMPPLPKQEPVQAMLLCLDFYNYRRAEQKDPDGPAAILDPKHWDSDLCDPSSDLFAISRSLTSAIWEFCDLPGGEIRTIAHDRRLYSSLPEKIGADFRLPPKDQFLGWNDDPSGCPHYHFSHLKCGYHCNPHKWGPCSPHDTES
jgi:hypothetical protein